MTNLQRIKNIENAEDMERAIQHANKISTYYTDSRRGMIQWLNDTVWDPYADAQALLNTRYFKV